MSKENKKIKKAIKMDLKKIGIILLLIATVAMYISSLLFI